MPVNRDEFFSGRIHNASPISSTSATFFEERQRNNVLSRGSFRVWEQTVSESVAKSSSKSFCDDGKIKHPANSVLYRPNERGRGWEVTLPISDHETPAYSSSTLFTDLSIFSNKNLLNIQSLPVIHHFLPANYPHSVCSSYTTYASYCFLASIAGSSAMVISTQALLVAVGVGTQSAAPMAAALNWVMKDGVGQLGGVMFASQLGKGGMDVGYWKSKVGKWTGGTFKRAKGNFQTGTADSNPKRWRMVAALALDTSTLLEICTPMMGPEWFLPCASVANIGKNIGFLAASASRAAVHQSLCMGGSFSHSSSSSMNQDDDVASSVKTSSNGEGKSTSKSTMNFNNNLGDVTAKAGSQAIVASLLGTALGILLSRTFYSDYGTSGILAGFIVLSTVHQICTYKALRAVPLKSLDRHRLHILLHEYMSKNHERAPLDKQFVDDQAKILTPSEVSQKDFFLPLMPPDDSVTWLTIGAPLLEICPLGEVELKSLLLSVDNISNNSLTLNDRESENYIIKVNPNDASVILTFLHGAIESDLLRGMFHAYVAHAAMSKATSARSEFEGSLEEKMHQIVKDSHGITIKHLPLFIDQLQQKGWEVGSGFVSVECGSSYRLGIVES
ncbi:hypothetical protein HJC23_010301 [Cyclotella cryptica]|uniref:Uncharacterized protein n=1 Tax=Cyclotella cryptica TaxID=29204 RepID=A0ABD3QNG1_9STRA